MRVEPLECAFCQPDAYGHHHLCATQPTMVTYPVPLRGNLIAEMVLPADLTKAEAERLAVFVRSLVVAPVEGAP